MRKPESIEHLYIDFDGFFASVEQQARPGLRGRPVGVIPFAGTRHTICIAVSKEAKAAGVKTGAPLDEARQICPDIVFVKQSPELYVRAHHALLAAIETCAPVDGACSIDELTARVDAAQVRDPWSLGRAIKRAIREEVGPCITGSIGMAANRHLAKIVCKWEKPDGLTIYPPDDMPGRLLNCAFEDIPGVGARMASRLAHAGIHDMTGLWCSQPKQLRAIWGSVAGERFWYLLHGYDVPGERTKRAMFGHGRVLPPSHRTLTHAKDYSMFLAMKAARRMRAEGYAAGRVGLWLSLADRSWSAEEPLAIVRDDQACLAGLRRLWTQAERILPPKGRVGRIGVSFLDLWRGERQLNLFLDDDVRRRRWEAITDALDGLHAKYGRTLVTVGPLSPPPGQYAGAKIAYTRIPDFRDFA